jgi:hypothetical protein
MTAKSNSYERYYKPADTFFKVNDLDIDRKTIVISLPKPPALETIDGWGEPPERQFFKRKEVPPRLLLLETEVLRELQDIKKENRQETVTGYKIIDGFWNLLEARADDYEKEIQYIKNIWWWRTWGYWFFNDGKPTYITGRHFMFLNFFTMPDVKENGGKPEYRDRHRREFLFRDYLRVAHHTFAKRDEKGWAVPEEDGHFEMRDMGMRLFYGVIHPKSRRNGSSIMDLSNMIEGAEAGFGRYSTIISKDGEATEEHYNLRLLPAWGARPFFLKPLWNGTSSPTQIKYFPPKNSFTGEGLMSVIDWTSSAGVVKKDGSKLNGFIAFDEEGKVSDPSLNVLQRWDVYKNGMSLGDGTIIIGECSHDSTVEDINAAGKAFLDMLETSDFYQRGNNGQTTSGLAAMVFPAYDGLEGFIDFFGQSVIHEPTERQLKMSPKAQFAILKQGAFQYQQEKREDFLKKGTPAAMQSYRAYIKKYPWRSGELTIGTSGDIGFDYEIIDKRMAELRQLRATGKLPMKIGNFYRKDNHPEGLVYWKTEENGKFEMSMELPQEQTNLKRRTMGWNVEQNKYIPQYEPTYKSRFVCGVDAFEYSNQKTDTGASKQSDGGIAILRERDESIDKSDNPYDWHTRTFVLSYRYRPASLQEFNEDALMACEYFGAMAFIERNKTSTWEYFINRGRGNYLKFEQDLMTGKLNDKPGFYSQGASKDELFTEIKDYITFRGHEENHLSFLEECRNIRAKDEMHKYDRLTAHGAALLGSRSPHGKVADMMNTQSIDLTKCSWLNG